MSRTTKESIIVQTLMREPIHVKTLHWTSAFAGVTILGRILFFVILVKTGIQE